MIFALKLTLVLHSGLQSVMLFIFHMLFVSIRICSHCLSLSMKLFTVCFYTHSTFPPNIPEYIYVNANMHAHTRSHTVHTLITRSINPFIFLFLVLCVLSPYVFHFNAQARAQLTCST